MYVLSGSAVGFDGILAMEGLNCCSNCQKRIIWAALFVNLSAKVCMVGSAVEIHIHIGLDVLVGY